MAEHILGMGTKKSIREVVALGEEIIAKIEGHPRILAVRAESLDVLAERPGYTGQFECFELKARVSADNLARVMSAVEA